MSHGAANSVGKGKGGAGSSPGVGKGKGGGREEQRARWWGPGGQNREPGDWKFLRNHRKMLAHMNKVGEAELQMAVSACDDAEKIFTRSQARRT